MLAARSTERIFFIILAPFLGRWRPRTALKQPWSSLAEIAVLGFAHARLDVVWMPMGDPDKAPLVWLLSVWQPSGEEKMSDKTL